MSETADEQELSRIAEKIFGLVEAQSGERKPYLVSALGLDLGDDLHTLKRLSGIGLNEFIQSRLADRLTLVRLGAHRNVAAVFIGSVDPSAIEQFPLAAPQRKRFHFRFWAAFSVPAEKDVRVLDMDDFTFTDVELSEVAEDAVTIDQALIAPVDVDERDELIKANIGQWLESRGLDEGPFLAPAKQRPPTVGNIQAGKTLLEAMISALDRKQLQATTLSLDVVATLLRTPRN